MSDCEFCDRGGDTLYEKICKNRKKMLLNGVSPCSSATNFFPRPEDKDNLDGLIASAQVLHDLGGFRLGTATSTLPKKILTKFTKSVRTMRGCFLMEMFLTTSNTFFGSSPSLPSLFHTIYQNPTKVISKYPLMFAQSLAFQIKTIYDKPLDFARAVALYFKEDDSQSVLFSYSTFPAIYSYFLGQEFCASASLFLIAFMVDAKQLAITETLLAAFFKAVPTFYTRLWSLLSDKMSNFGKTQSFDKLYSTFEECLKSSLCHLTEHHINAFASFAQTYPTRIINFFIDKILISQFTLASTASQFLPHKQHNSEYLKFFNDLKLPAYKDKALTLVSLVREHKKFLEVIPSMSCSIWTRGVPLFLCESDLSLLSDIFETSNRFKFTVQSDLSLSKSYDLFYMDVFPSFIDEKSISNDEVCKALFGDKPPQIELPENEYYKRYWRSLTMQAKVESVDPFTFLQDHKNKEKYSRLRSIDFLSYCYKAILSEYHDNYCELEKSVLLAEHNSKLQDLKNSIDFYMQILFHKYSSSFLKRTISRERGSFMTKLSKAISKVVCEEEVSNKTKYEIACAALDSVEIQVTSLFQAEGKKFITILNSWMENVWPKLENHGILEERMVHILNSAAAISHIGDLKFGKRLIVLIEFMRSLTQILGTELDTYWLNLLHVSLMASDTADILSTFLFLHHYVFADQSLVKEWGRFTISMWNLFAAGMWDILKGDQELFLKCQDESKMKLFFKINTSILDIVL